MIDLEAIRARDARIGILMLHVEKDRRALLTYMDELLALLHRTEDEKMTLREAAGKVTCWECNDSGRMVNGLYALPTEPEFIPCPYCAPIRNLRALLGESHEGK